MCERAAHTAKAHCIRSAERGWCVGIDTAARSSTKRRSINTVCSVQVIQQNVTGRLYQSTHSQVLLYDDVVDSGHDESYLHRVGRACEVGVDLLSRVLVKPTEKRLVSYTCGLS